MRLHKLNHLLHLLDFRDLAPKILGDLLEDSRNFHLFLHEKVLHSYNFFSRFQLDKIPQEFCKSFYARQCSGYRRRVR